MFASRAVPAYGAVGQRPRDDPAADVLRRGSRNRTGGRVGTDRRRIQGTRAATAT